MIFCFLVEFDMQWPGETEFVTEQANKRPKYLLNSELNMYKVSSLPVSGGKYDPSDPLIIWQLLPPCQQSMELRERYLRGQRASSDNCLSFRPNWVFGIRPSREGGSYKNLETCALIVDTSGNLRGQIGLHERDTEQTRLEVKKVRVIVWSSESPYIKLQSHDSQASSLINSAEILVICNFAYTTTREF